MFVPLLPTIFLLSKNKKSALGAVKVKRKISNQTLSTAAK
jgi:hypothetical protein